MSRVVVEADGGSRGNPGPAGYGAVVKDADSDAVLAERKAGIGIATNNVAEYQGLIAGLVAAAELGASTVDFRMDSKLVVEQMSGRWKIKNATLQPLALRARELASTFARIEYTWIPRARNAHADGLANEAMDEQESGEADPVGDVRPAERSVGRDLGSARSSPTEQRQPTSWLGAKGAPTRLVLLRHGQTALSVCRRYSGRGDIDLTDLGSRQAAAAANRLSNQDELLRGEKSVPIISSPLRRAKKTADSVAGALGCAVSTHEGLREADFGEWEGLTFDEAALRDPELHARWLADSEVAAPAGESFADTYGRIRAISDELIESYRGQTVVIVSHVTPIKSMLRIGLDAGPELLFRLHLDLASLSIVDFYPDGNASVRLVNDTAHLVGL